LRSRENEIKLIPSGRKNIIAAMAEDIKIYFSNIFGWIVVAWSKVRGCDILWIFKGLSLGIIPKTQGLNMKKKLK
jgi:hypothetical protein